MLDTQPLAARTVFSLTYYLPGLTLSLAIAGAAFALRHMSGIAVLSPLLVAVLAGIAVRVVFGLNDMPQAGVKFAARPLLRLGIVLLGLQITLGQIADLGMGVVVIAALSLAVTYGAMMGFARLIGVPRPLAQLMSAGTAVCGASAIVAANAVARGDEEDVGYAIASITLFGTLAMLVMPLLAQPLGLSAIAYGVWTGASIHEVAQVTAAAFQGGAASGEVGTVTKLVRVMLLAPLVMAMALAARSAMRAGGADHGTAQSVIFPWFVVGFLALVVLNSLIAMPVMVTSASGVISTLLMAAGLAAMGLSIDLRQLRNRGLKPLVLGAVGSVFIAGTALLLVRVLL